MMSIFQGAESIKVNTSLERAAEEEALEDQRRRNEELGNLLQNAFDDLEEEETTVDSTSNFQSHLPDEQHHYGNKRHAQQDPMPSPDSANIHNGQGVKVHLDVFEEEVHKLKMLLESRTRELDHIKQYANEEHKQREELQKRLNITEAELDRALASKKSTHELLVESKEKCSNLENTIDKLRSEKKSLESEHNSILGKLETAQMLLGDVQHKYDMVQRGLQKNSERSADQRCKQMEERHKAETEMLHSQMEQLTNKLEKKDNELENMNARYQALQSTHEKMLVDKASKINDLNYALGEVQSKCEELLAKPDYFQENIRLQKLIASLQEQIKTMDLTIKSLTERLNITTSELDILDKLLHQHNKEDTSHHLSQTQGKVVGSTPLSAIDRVGNLKDELYRALSNVKGKREEIRSLQQSVDEKSTELRKLREEENKSLVQISTLKEANERLQNRLKVLEEECEELRQKTLEQTDTHSNNDNANEMLQLKEEKNKLKERCNQLELECNNHEEKRKKLDAQLRNVEVDLEELKQEHESMKLNYEHLLKENKNLRSRSTADNLRLELEKHKFLLKDAQAECDRLKNLYVEISNTKEALSYEMEKLRNADCVKELQEQQEKVAHLQRALQLAEVKSSELSKILETEKLCHEREISAMKEKCEKEKSNNVKASKTESSNNCTKCIDYMAEITKFEIQNLKLSNINSITKKEVDDLTVQLIESKALIAELTQKLRLSEQQEQLINELKVKANKFEEYIKNHSSASEKSQPNENSDTKLHSAEIKKIESRIRDDVAKIFASELKRFQIKLQQTEEKNMCLQQEYQHVTCELQQRQTEVELLKQAILAERERMDELMKQKDIEAKELLEKQNAILHKCRKDLLAKNQRVSQLCKELDERQAQIEAERQSMKAVMMQWEKQRKNADAIECEWKEKLQEIQCAHEKAIIAWQKKYNSAKHTAANYKRYAEDKETHMLREYERIKSEYDTSLTKIEMRMREALEKKSRELQNALDKIEKRHELGYDKENQTKN